MTSAPRPQPTWGKDFTNAQGPLFSVEAFRGFRAWYMDEPMLGSGAAKAGLLRSITYSYWWTSGVNLSICQARKLKLDHESHDGLHDDDCYRRCAYPTKECTCGFYAYFKEEYFTVGVSANHLKINGVVDATGRLVKGSKGFRAQAANIVALALPPVDEVPKSIQKVCDDATPAEVLELARQALAKNYPTIPVFDSVPPMLSLIPLTEI